MVTNKVCVDMIELPSDEGHILFSEIEGEILQQCRKHDGVLQMKPKGVQDCDFVTLCFRSGLALDIIATLTLHAAISLYMKSQQKLIILCDFY